MLNLEKNLREVDWDQVCSNGDANASNNMFGKFNELYDMCIQKKKIIKKKHTKRTPLKFHRCSLLKCLHRKNRLCKRYMIKLTVTNLTKYKMYRNRLNSVLRLATQNYFRDKERKHNGDYVEGIERSPAQFKDVF